MPIHQLRSSACCSSTDVPDEPSATISAGRLHSTWPSTCRSPCRPSRGCSMWPLSPMSMPSSSQTTSRADTTRCCPRPVAASLVPPWSPSITDTASGIIYMAIHMPDSMSSRSRGCSTGRCLPCTMPSSGKQPSRADTTKLLSSASCSITVPPWSPSITDTGSGTTHAWPPTCPLRSGRECSTGRSLP